LVFLLASESSEGQLDLLQRIVELLQNREIRERIIRSGRTDKVVRILSEMDQPSRGEERWRKNG